MDASISRRLDHRAAPGRFTATVVQEDGLLRIVPEGELDLATVERLRVVVDDAVAGGDVHVVIDLRGLTFMDSTGLRLLIDLHRAAQTDGWRLSLLRGEPAVQRVFEVTAADQLLPFVDPAALS